ncbi:hypothetical protein GCM10023336_42170 [Streptomyces similanensis]|uniref:Uncharacterized protein n=1 Tax=Streptomyces similanensis TaxID=1274988 RepID=A0ABP9KSS2_9ACTN
MRDVKEFGTRAVRPRPHGRLLALGLIHPTATLEEAGADDACGRPSGSEWFAVARSGDHRADGRLSPRGGGSVTTT